MFAGSGAGGSSAEGQAGPGGQPNAEGVFADVFEEVCSLLRLLNLHRSCSN